MINIYRKIKMTLENIPDDPMIPPTCPLEVPGSSPMMIPAGLGFGGGGLGFSFGLGGRTSIWGAPTIGTTFVGIWPMTYDYRRKVY